MQSSAIFYETDVLGLTGSLYSACWHVCPCMGTHEEASVVVCVSLLFSVLHCSSRKQKGYHLSFGWIVQRREDQFPLRAGLCHEPS